MFRLFYEAFLSLHFVRVYEFTLRLPRELCVYTETYTPLANSKVPYVATLIVVIVAIITLFLPRPCASSSLVFIRYALYLF